MRDLTPVRRCVCCDVTFERLRASGLESLEDIQRAFGCSTKCGCCGPYIERMLETGETAFAIIQTAAPTVYRNTGS